MINVTTPGKTVYQIDDSDLFTLLKKVTGAGTNTQSLKVQRAIINEKKFNKDGQLTINSWTFTDAKPNNSRVSQ
jgi:hypothetical protein